MPGQQKRPRSDSLPNHTCNAFDDTDGLWKKLPSFLSPLKRQRSLSNKNGRRTFVPVPNFADTIQLCCEHSKAGGGCLNGQLGDEICQGVFTLNAEGYLYNESTHFVFHEPLHWMPSPGQTEFFLKLADDKPLCIAILDDRTVGLKTYHPNSSTSSVPPEARLVIEHHGDGNDSSTFLYRIRFSCAPEAAENILYYLGAYGNGVVGVFEQHSDDPFPPIGTLFKINRRDSHKPETSQMRIAANRRFTRSLFTRSLSRQ